MIFNMNMRFNGRTEIAPSQRGTATTILRALLDDVYENVSAFGSFYVMVGKFGLENRGEVEVECEFDAYPSHDDMKTYLRTLTQGRPLDAWVRVFARVVDGPVLGEVLHASRVGNVITWEEYQMPAPPDVSTEG